MDNKNETQFIQTAPVDIVAAKYRRLAIADEACLCYGHYSSSIKPPRSGAGRCTGRDSQDDKLTTGDMLS